jgi:hypothetical protein
LNFVENKGIMKAMMPIKKTAIAGLSVFFCGLISLGFAAKIDPRLKSRYDPIIRRIAARYTVDPALIHSIIAAESAYDRWAVSNKGALGLMQLMPETAKDYGVQDAFSADDNIEGGVKLLKNLQKIYPRQPDLVIAAYNAGHKAVQDHGGIPPYPETRNYVAQVKDYWAKESRPRKTTIYEFVDSRGKRVITNDIRLVSASKSRTP